MKSVIRKIETKIFTIRGVQVMLDSDLAVLYHVETKRLNEQVKRNYKRFPKSFMFQLKNQEWKNLRSQIATAKRRSAPFAFTEHGVAMLSAVLTSNTAIAVSLQIVEAFIAMRKNYGQLQGVISRLTTVEKKQFKTDAAVENILEALKKESTPKQGIFFEGQLFDAHVFVSNLIKQAKISISLIDNYVDENTMLLLSKRRPKVKCIIYSRLKAVLIKDLKKHNQQYATIELI